MRTAILVINEFLNNIKFNEIHKWLVEAATRSGIDLKVKTNAEILVSLGNRHREKHLDGFIMVQEEQANLQSDPLDFKPEFILFWDKDIRLARYLENLGYLVFNSSKAIEACDDKSLTHMILQNARIPMPNTILAPMTYGGIGYTNYNFLNRIIKSLGFPMVVKECFGSFGQQVYLVHNEEELLNQVKEIGSKPMLFQQYLNSSFARDIRLNVVGERVVASMYRYSDSGDFRANISNGGKMKPYTPTKEQEELAVKCCMELGLDFAGVDLLFGEKEEPIVCEVNSNAHFKNIYDCTSINVADYIIEHILRNIKR